MTRTIITKFFKVFFVSYAFIVSAISFSIFELEKSIILISEWYYLPRAIFLIFVLCLTAIWVIHDINLTAPRDDNKV